MHVLTLLIAAGVAPQRCAVGGEPASEFLVQLRQARLFDTAIAYLDRIDEYPGVDPNLVSSVDLEKAQTYIDAAVASRNSDQRDDYFQQAEEKLNEFLNQGPHPRASQARLQLGKLQMVRAGQLLAGTPDAGKVNEARESYLSAAKTFDTIVEELRSRLKEMQGARIDAVKDPKAAAMRDQYRGEFLQAISSAAKSRLLAAKTFDDPAKQAQAPLQAALAGYTELSEKYGSYVQGAISLAFRGQVQSELGLTEEAIDSFTRMLEQQDADPLREAKILATTGIIEAEMSQSPPDYQAAIDRGQPMFESVRDDEQSWPSVKDLRLELAKAYLAKANDKANQESVELKRAETASRKMLVQASRDGGEHADEANQLLAEIGIDMDAVVELPKFEDPKSLGDALETSRALLAAGDNLNRSLEILEAQSPPLDDIETQKANLIQQLGETRMVAIQVLQRGLAMVDQSSDTESLNQVRQHLSYLLYQEKRYREASVVGAFLARHAPATDLGLRGGLLALNSLQMLVVEDPGNAGLMQQLEGLGAFLTETWPDNPEANAAQSVLTRIALKGENWDDARNLVDQMAAGPERAFYQRLMGQLLWNKSIELRQQGEDAAADNVLRDAEKDLRVGLDGISEDVANPEAMKAALTLAKIYLKQQDVEKASGILDHETYGPVVLVNRNGPPDEAFASDLYSTELQVVVQRMTSGGADPKTLLDRAIEVMEKLRESVTGPDAEKRLTGIYVRMARDIREQLDSSDPAKKAKLIEAFRVFLERISSTTKDDATLQWVGQTLIDLAAASMPEGATKATGQSAELLKTAVDTLQRLKTNSDDPSLTIDYQLGKAQRQLGNYKESLDMLEELLSEKPMMLDAQVEAALAYEQWAAVIAPKFRKRAYEAALSGGRPNAEKQNVIWGWGKISRLTSGAPKYTDIFFSSRYHIALCHFLWGKAARQEALIKKSASDITKVSAVYPAMGGAKQRADFNRLLKLIQNELGQPAVGLPPIAGKQK